MLITSISLSTKTKASETHLHLKKGDPAPSDLWCFNATRLKKLRNSIESCEQDRIELKHLRKLKSDLVATQTSHKPIWAQWWVKLPAGIALGALAGILASKGKAEDEVAAVTGAVVGAGTVVLLDLDF